MSLLCSEMSCSTRSMMFLFSIMMHNVGRCGAVYRCCVNTGAIMSPALFFSLDEQRWLYPGRIFKRPAFQERVCICPGWCRPHPHGFAIMYLCLSQLILSPQAHSFYLRSSALSLHHFLHSAIKKKNDLSHFDQNQKWHSSSSSTSWWLRTKTCGAHNSPFLKKIVARSFHSWWQSAATNNGGTQHTSHVTFFSVMAHMCNDVPHVMWLKCLCASSHPCVMRLVVCLISLRPSSHSSFVSPIFYFILLNFDGARSLVLFAHGGVWSFGQ